MTGLDDSRTTGSYESIDNEVEVITDFGPVSSIIVKLPATFIAELSFIVVECVSIDALAL